jgi:hypothetical protein
MPQAFSLLKKPLLLVNKDIRMTQKKSQQRTIKSVKQLPTWFKLENYQDTNKLDADSWYDELMTRYFTRNALKYKEKYVFKIWEMIKNRKLLNDEESASKALKSPDNILSQCEEGGGFRLNAITPRLHQLQILPKNAQPAESPARAVGCITNLMMYGAYWCSEKSVQDVVIQKLRGLVDSEKERWADQPEEDSLAWIHQPFDRLSQEDRFNAAPEFAFAWIDLEASDEQIKAEFSRWLTKERDRRNVPAVKKSFNENDFQGFYESAVLPYLDLMYWATLEKVKINQYVIAQAIFPDAYAPESEVDPLGRLKTTKKKADYLMKYDTLRRLELQTTRFKIREKDVLIRT